MKRLLILAAALALPAAAQTPKQPDPKNMDEARAQIRSLAEQLAEAKIALYTARMNVMQCQASPIVSDRQQAIKDIEALNPGKHWDDNRGILIDNPPNQPAAPQPKK